jgi:uncharacterized protein (TIGR04255 family)
MSKPLPEFERPPVIEVVLSVQFERLEALCSPQLGFVWQAFRDRFPNTEEHPRLEPAFEQFGPKVGVGAGVHFELLSSLPSPRVWFLNAVGTELVQIQQDRFIRNWRKKADNDQYPRYSFLRDQFTKDLDQFQRLVAEQGWGNIEPNQCEITYVNVIPAGDGWNVPGELGRVCTLFSPIYSDDGLGIPEEAAVNARYIIGGDGDEALGRLHVAIVPVVRTTDGSPAFRLNLTARGRPADVGTDAVLRFLDRGHEAIVRGFASITTPEMHALWGRKL